MFGGLAMFLYGMELMGDGLKLTSGETLKRIMEKLTRNAFTGMLTGMLVTAIIQSSSATIVLSVGLMSAGLLTLRQAISIVMGANIGTTVTAQIIRLMDIDSSGNVILEFFKPTTLAPVTMVVGILLIMFIKKRGTRGVGEIFMGFGVLFSGLLTMTSAVSPLAESQAFLNILTRFADIPVLGILTGLVVTVVVQSSSAVIGMLQALSSTGAITFDVAYPLIMGSNLGTCIVTAFLCSINSTKDAKRTGVAHILFNVIGTVVFMVAMTVLHRLGAFGTLWTSVVNSGSIADFQTLFNLVTALLLLPFVNLLMTATMKIVKPDERDRERAADEGLLDEKLLVSPGLAMAEAGTAVGRMGSMAEKNLTLSFDQLTAYDPKRSEAISAREDRLDALADRADNFLVSLSRLMGSEKNEAQLNLLMQAVPDFERIGDYATNLDELGMQLSDTRVTLSDRAKAELGVMYEAVGEIVRLTVEAFTEDDNGLAAKVEPLEEVIDDMVVLLRDNHTERLREGTCTIGAGLVFLEALTHLERAADQCSSIALLMQARTNERIRESHHMYLRELHAEGNYEYDAELRRRREQYLPCLKG